MDIMALGNNPGHWVQLLLPLENSPQTPVEASHPEGHYVVIANLVSGLEHLTRSLSKAVVVMLIVVEPYRCACPAG